MSRSKQIFHVVAWERFDSSGIPKRIQLVWGKWRLCPGGQKMICTNWDFILKFLWFLKFFVLDWRFVFDVHLKLIFFCLWHSLSKFSQGSVFRLALSLVFRKYESSTFIIDFNFKKIHFSRLLTSDFILTVLKIAFTSVSSLSSFFFSKSQNQFLDHSNFSGS